MPAESTAPYPFGDLLALARQSWLAELARRLAERGYVGYRRTDAATTRMLWSSQVPVGQLAARLGGTRQAARKVADNLQRRGYVTTAQDPRDTRQVNVALTPAGRDYAMAVVVVIAELNREICQHADPNQLAAADAILRAALFDDGARQLASRLPRPAARVRSQ